MAMREGHVRVGEGRLKVAHGISARPSLAGGSLTWAFAPGVRVVRVVRVVSPLCRWGTCRVTVVGAVR